MRAISAWVVAQCGECLLVVAVHLVEQCLRGEYLFAQCGTDLGVALGAAVTGSSGTRDGGCDRCLESCPLCGTVVADVNRGIEKHAEEPWPGDLALDLPHDLELL